MEDLQKTTEVLNDLIRINNDRIEGYQKAINELPADSADLKVLFSNYVSQSQDLKNELISQSGSWNDNASQETTTSGKIYRGWMGLKASIATDDRKAMLESCEYGEDAAQKAYRDAELENNLTQAARSLIVDQKNQLRRAHDEVKALRDSHR